MSTTAGPEPVVGLSLEVAVAEEVAAVVELEEVELEEVEPGPVTWSSQLLLSLEGTALQTHCSCNRLKLFTKLGAPSAGSSSVGWS